MIYIPLVINIILLVIGQTLWKMGLVRIDFRLSIHGVLKVILNPYILGGLFVYAAATLVWLYILSKAQLSLVYPLQSLCYVGATVVAILIFKENIPLTRWIGIGLIVFGAYFVSR